MPNYRAIVIGCSSGGHHALAKIIPELPENFPLPVIVVQHLSPDSMGTHAAHLAERTRLNVREAEDKEEARAGTIYLAPANYHLLVEAGGHLALSVDEKEHHSRPSIDVLFESAAAAYGGALVGVILTGANADGAAGLKKINDAGGLPVVQDPATAESPTMPRAAIMATAPQHIIPLERLGAFLASLGSERDRESGA